MILLVALTITVLIAVLRGGRLRHLGRLSIRWPWLPILTFLVQAYMVFYPAERSESLLTLRASVLVGSYLCLLAMAWGNRRLPGIRLIALGVLMNLVVMVVNGGYMPVTPEALVTAGHQGLAYGMESGARVASSKDIVLERKETILWWLSDVFVIPRDWPLSGSFSLGDVVIALGAFVLIQAAMLDRNLEDEARSVPLRKEIEPTCADGVSWEARMAGRTLDIIIGLALVDESFCQALLSNSNDLLADFELAPDEREALASIRADSLELFAKQLWDRLESTGGTEDHGLTQILK